MQVFPFQILSIFFICIPVSLLAYIPFSNGDHEGSSQRDTKILIIKMGEKLILSILRK